MTDKNNCIHCGNDCGKHPIIFDDKPFCCSGCSAVYKILNRNDLSQYYTIANMPGIKIEDNQKSDNEKYDFLDLEQFRQKIIKFSANGISKVSFFIPEIHCASCIWLLENLNTLNGGIIRSIVNFPKKEVNISFRENEISLRQLVELLTSINYVPEISQHSIDENKKGSYDKSLFIKIGIAAFGFMNTMIYHFPQYLPGNEYLESNFKTLFGWLSILISIPVLVYSASDYFINAIKSLKFKIISIDFPIALGLATLFIQSFHEVVSGAGIGYIDSLTGLVFFMLIGRWYQSKTYNALSFERDYKTYFPLAVVKLSESGKEPVSLNELKSGDRILVRNQEIIPADATLSKGTANIDYSFVTGESMPVNKSEGDFVFAGGRQIGGAIELIIEKEVEQSYLTQLWNQAENPDELQNKLKTVINRVSQYFTPVIIVIAIISTIFWLNFNPDIALFAFTSVLIIACPCALALTVPFTFGSTIRQFGRRGFYLKNTSVTEKLQKIDTIVFDKTGTITNTNSNSIDYEGKDLTYEEKKLIGSLVYHSTHPLSKSISNFLAIDSLYEVEQFKEMPALGISGTANNSKVYIGSKYFVTGSKSKDEIINTEVWISINNNIAGCYKFRNNYRDGFVELVKSLKEKYSLHLLSGDNDSEKMKLTEIFGDNENLHFNQSPSDKLEYIKKLQSENKKVVMIGDGLNDAGALNQSDVGIVIADNVFNFSPACDAILKADKFASLNKFISFTHKSMSIVKAGFAISFLYNIVGLSFAVQGNLTPIVAAVLMPISSVTVVAFASFSVNLNAKLFKL